MGERGLLVASRSVEAAIAARVAAQTPYRTTSLQELNQAVSHTAQFLETLGSRSDALLNLRLDVQELSARYPRTGASDLVREILALRDEAMILANGADDSTRREAMLLLALTTGLLAKANHDLGHSENAAALAGFAHSLAGLAGHDELASWCITLSSFIAYWRRDSKLAERQAAHAQKQLIGRRTATALWTNASLARSTAARGNEAAAVRALKAGDEILEDLEPSDLDDFYGIFAFSGARYQYYASDALVQVDGATCDAGARAALAIEMYEALPARERSYSDEAGARVILAQTQFLRGQFTQGLEVVTPVFMLPSSLRINGIRRTLERTTTAILRSGYGLDHSQVRDLLGEARSFCSPSGGTG